MISLIEEVNVAASRELTHELDEGDLSEVLEISSVEGVAVVVGEQEHVVDSSAGHLAGLVALSGFVSGVFLHSKAST